MEDYVFWDDGIKTAEELEYEYRQTRKELMDAPIQSFDKVASDFCKGVYCGDLNDFMRNLH